MGAGRSGTTLLATLLGGSKHILTLGEMHQFLDHILLHEQCSCQKQIDECEFWKEIYQELLSKYSKDELKSIKEHLERTESHSRIPHSLFFHDKKYGDFQRELLSLIEKRHLSHSYLDSSKYISKMLQLKKTSGISLKSIYVVRDVRGVISSFKKNVQTPKKPLSTIVYYLLINFFGTLVYWRYGKKQVLKLRYEDLVENPSSTMTVLEQFLVIDLEDVKEKIEAEDYFNMPHFIGGNRMTSNRKIRLKSDLKWKSSLSRAKQIFYYFAAAPTMILNKYRV